MNDRENEKRPCARCGVPRNTRPGRSPYCQDCQAAKETPVDRERTWMDDANCLDVDPEIFFPDKERMWQKITEAKRICGGCPVAAQCLADTPMWDEFSVRGGLTAHERRKLRRGEKVA